MTEARWNDHDDANQSTTQCHAVPAAEDRPIDPPKRGRTIGAALMPAARWVSDVVLVLAGVGALWLTRKRLPPDYDEPGR